MRQLKVHTTTVKPTHLPNLERAANFLEDLPALWLHPGVTHEDREALVRQVFRRITIDGKEFVDIEPKPEYAPFLHVFPPSIASYTHGKSLPPLR